MRVLAIAARRARQPTRVALAGRRLRLLGLVGLSDPPREEAVEAIAACRRAGITVKMITGRPRRDRGRDRARARPASDRAMTGLETRRARDDALAARRTGTDVFARVAPEHKLRLVRALQAEGHVVAMTGDGVNDAPALRQADIGVAMGRTGTAVAREAADIVLADDRFSTIEAAVEEGRRVYDNLEKAIAFVLPTNFGEALILLVAVLAFPFGRRAACSRSARADPLGQPGRHGHPRPAAGVRGARARPDAPAAARPARALAVPFRRHEDGVRRCHDGRGRDRAVPARRARRRRVVSPGSRRRRPSRSPRWPSSRSSTC